MVTLERFPRFEARAPWLGADLQTVRNALRGPVVGLSPERRGVRFWLPLLDGTGDCLAARAFEPEEPRDGVPLVLVIHGLGGDETSAYIQVTTTRLLSVGYPVMQLNLRGAGPSRSYCRGQYHAGRTADLRDALAALPAAMTRNGVVVVGYSLGGNVTLKYAAEYGGLRGAVSISAPIDLAASSRRFLHWRNRFYHRHLLRAMKAEVLAAKVGVTEEERALIPRLRTILEFDERIVAPRHGYSGADDYYARNHARQFLASIKLPTLVIFACDDPWIPREAYTDYPWPHNPRLIPLLAPGGGHVGFHARGSPIPWHDRCLEVFLETL